MLFPKSKMQVTSAYEGKTSEEGWLVLDFTKIDTEGIDKVYIDLTDVIDLQKKKGEQADLLRRTRDMLSLDD